MLKTDLERAIFEVNQKLDNGIKVIVRDHRATDAVTHGLITGVTFMIGSIVFKSRKDNQIINKCVYSLLGINMEGQKEVLGCWLSENEGASFYAGICSDLKKRGVTDIFVACHDNLKGLSEAINSDRKIPARACFKRAFSAKRKIMSSVSKNQTAALHSPPNPQLNQVCTIQR